MFHIVRSEDGQLDGTADTVVGTQRRALSRQPLTINVCTDRILIEIKFHVDEFVAYHVHVTLQYDGLAVLHALRGRLSDNHVARFVGFRVKSVALTPILQVSNHLLLALRRARDFVNLRKFFEDNSGF